ncbi:MAG: hypothetical protein IH991_24235, partial [Planctomycetes bacterium]|nr:hypothetical protein [Planctomycetota bacterium]
MKRPWQNWILFFLCLVVVFPAMAWLTVKVLELDQQRAVALEETEQARMQEADARRRADLAREQATLAKSEYELQGLISSALWRMDSVLTPLIAHEAARPYFLYQSVLTSGGKTKRVSAIPSPLLTEPSEFVLLYFQVSPENKWSSPQYPETDFANRIAAANGVAIDDIAERGELLQALAKSTSLEQLVPMLPDRFVPSTQVKYPWSGNLALNYPQQGAQRQIENNIESQPGQQARANSGPQVGVNRGANPPRVQPVNRQSDILFQQQLDQQLAFDRAQINQRGSDELQSRNRTVQSVLFNTLSRRYNPSGLDLPEDESREGVSRPFWVGRNLLLARRVAINGELFIQGCWLD